MYPVGNQSLGSLDRLTTNRQLQSDVHQANCYLYACSPGLNLQRRTRTTVTNISRWWRGGLANLLERQLNDIVELPQQWFADPGGRAVLIWQQTKISSRRKELSIIYGNTVWVKSCLAIRLLWKLYSRVECTMVVGRRTETLEFRRWW